MRATLSTTPRADGFRMPAEWEPHTACWMAWPERTDNWRDRAKPAQAAYAEVAAAINAREPVTMAVSATQMARARALLPESVRVVELASDDAWMRDIGPTFVTGAGERRGIDWRFNAWGGFEGGLYHPWDQDDAAAGHVLAIQGDARYRAQCVLEGGSIHVDGEGTVLVTEQCMLNRNRNPHLTRRQIEKMLCEYLGAQKVIWLGQGLFNDETDGHVDNLACFVKPGVVLLAWTDDRSDPQYEISVDALRRLRAATDAHGRRLEVIPIPLPGPLFLTEDEAAGVEPAPGAQPRRAGDRLAASYVNFYLAGDRVIYPLLDERCDDMATAVLNKCFPEHELVGIQAREILLGGGNIHCITQQVPSAG
jgi:agmatine deiminase